MAFFRVWSPPKILDSKATVSSLMNPDGYGRNVALIDQILLPFEASQVKQIYLSPRKPPDRLVWKFSRNGSYTVRSAYHWLMNQSDPNSSGGSSHEECDNIHWRGVWSLSIPPKVKHFVWRALKNSLPTRANLLRRGVAVDSTCGQCDAATESLDHCLLECTRARSFWFGSSLGLRWSNDW